VVVACMMVWAWFVPCVGWGGISHAVAQPKGCNAMAWSPRVALFNQQRASGASRAERRLVVIRGVVRA
jgi:hypothetical protein